MADSSSPPTSPPAKPRSRLLDLDGELKDHVGPRRKSNCCSSFTFWGATSIVRQGSKKPLEHHQLWKVDEENRAHITWKRVETYWLEELELLKQGQKPSLFRTIRRTFLGEWSVIFVLLLFYAALNFTTPVLLPRLLTFVVAAKFTPQQISYIETSGQPFAPAVADIPQVRDWHGYTYVAAIVVATILSSFCNYHAQLKSYVLGLKIRSAFTMLIYNKALYVRTSKTRNTGQITNLIANDAQFILDTLAPFNAGTISPVQIIVSIILIGLQIGWFCLIPIGVLFLTIPYNAILGKKTGEARFRQQKATDSRVKFVKEFVSAMRIVKYYAWEVPFRRNITAAREQELKAVFDSLWVRGQMLVVLINVPSFGIGLTFALYGIANTLDPSSVFTTVALLNLLRPPFILFSLVISFALQYRVTFSRIQSFLTSPELARRPDADEQNRDAKYSVVIDKASFSYSPEDPTPPVSVGIVSLKVKKGELVMVIGMVGSGKSTLVQAAINEVPIVSGTAHTYGSVAYVPQEAWIVNATVRDNITFGKPYDETLFKRVAKVSCLVPDFEMMPAGDLTEIGERGVNLSGGQKQRISIARALYADRDVYILDDILSAVDAHVAQSLAQNAIIGYLKGHGKTVLFVTNQLQFLPLADRILMMSKGEIVESGTFTKLKAAGKGFSQLMDDFGMVEEKDSKKKPTLKSSNGSEGSGSQLLDGFAKKKPLTAAEEEAKLKEELDMQQKGVLIAAEGRETGNISAKVYNDYISFGGTMLFIGIIITFALRVATRTYSALWLSYWAQDYPENPDPHISNPKHIWIVLYITAIVAEVLSVGCGFVLQNYWSIKASRKLNNIMMDKLQRATITWFDATPIGRLLTRFSKDLALVDVMLPQSVDQVLNFMSIIAGIFAQLAIGNQYLLIIVGFVIVVYFVLFVYYRPTSIEIQRLESISRAPIISHMTQSLEGAATIRAFRLEKPFMVACMNTIDNNTVDYYSLRYCFSWFGLRLDWAATAMILATYFSVVLTRVLTPDQVDTSFAGLAMSATGPLTFLLSILSQNLVDLETRMNSVERLREYDNLPQEAPAHIEETAPPASWPTKGKIEFKKLSISYNAKDRVLKQISAKIKPKEKIGLVGRTGSGKSTLITALFRMMEFHEGTITIDGVDLSKIGLDDLRTKLSIIPQTPTLFMGTVRYNVDPFDNFSDADVWRVLEMVQLKEYVSSLEGQLLALVEENGSNFSVGQRQLLAMARALLRNAPILLLDEATAATDAQSDQLIQKLIRQHFNDKTILTIAHRLNTIMDSDRVMVLNAGEIAEFDSPSNLLDNKKGIFASMVDATGPASSAYLKKIARGELKFVDSIPDDVLEESGEDGIVVKELADTPAPVRNGSKLMKVGNGKSNDKAKHSPSK